MSAKHLKHICKNCWWFTYNGDESWGKKGRCYNCVWPNGIRDKKPNDVCDGGGIGADDYGFKPNEDLYDER